MNAKHTGGPAFPTERIEHVQAHNTHAAVPVRVLDGGMTLRDYFAAQSLPSVIAGHKAVDDIIVPGVIASVAYAIADAMLKARAA